MHVTNSLSQGHHQWSFVSHLGLHLLLLYYLKPTSFYFGDTRKIFDIFIYNKIACRPSEFILCVLVLFVVTHSRAIHTKRHYGVIKKVEISDPFHIHNPASH